MKSIIALTVILFLSGNSPAQDMKTDFWLTFEQLEDSLNVNPKPVFIYFHTDWCTYCRKMESEVFSKPDIISILSNNLYAVKFDAEFKEKVIFDGQVFSNQQLKTHRFPVHDLVALFLGQNHSFSPPLMLVFDKNFRLKNRANHYLDSKALYKMLSTFQ